MFNYLLIALAFTLSSTIALAETSYCFKGAVTVGNISSEATKNFRKLLRFEMQEYVEVMDEDGDCDYEAEGFVIQSGDQFRVGVRILSEGVREKTIATLVDEESEISAATRSIAKKLSKWNEESNETAESAPTNATSIRSNIIAQAYLPKNPAFEIGAGAATQRGLGLNIIDELNENSVYLRLDFGHYALRLDAAESFYSNPSFDYQYETVNRSVGIGTDLFAFASGFTPYIGLSANYQITQYPTDELIQEPEAVMADASQNEFTGISGSARVGIMLLRLKSAPIRIGAEAEYRAVPLYNSENYGGIAGAKLQISLVPGQILGS
jgi:hypothetical protein